MNRERSELRLNYCIGDDFLLYFAGSYIRSLLRLLHKGDEYMRKIGKVTYGTEAPKPETTSPCESSLCINTIR